MKNNEYQNISNNLTKYRKAVGLKQKEVAKILGIVNPNQISKWEKGICFPSLIHILKLTALYKVSVETLYSNLIEDLEVKKELQKEEILKRIIEKEG